MGFVGNMKNSENHHTVLMTKTFTDNRELSELIRQVLPIIQSVDIRVFFYISRHSADIKPNTVNAVSEAYIYLIFIF